MVDPASVLIREVETRHPSVYANIVALLKPHTVESLARLLRDHLYRSDVAIDLEIFDRNREAIPAFLYDFTRFVRKNFPSGGNPSGIEWTCRLTRDDTQDVLDSRHLKVSLFGEEEEDERISGVAGEKKTNKKIIYEEEFYKLLNFELNLYRQQSQILEIAGKKKFSSVFLRPPGLSVRTIASIFHKDFSVLKSTRKLNDWSSGCAPTMARFICVSTPFEEEKEEERITRILYHQQHARDRSYLLTHLPLDSFDFWNDVKQVYEKCGPACYFLNALRIVREHFGSRDSRHEKDLCLALKFQTSVGKPLLPLNREGLAGHPGRSPFEVMVFEAMKKNCVRSATRPKEGCLLRTIEGNTPFFEYSVAERSTDRMAVGIPFLEGTGYHFAVVPLQNPGQAKGE